MKKIYTFNNFIEYSKNHAKWQEVNVEAETILEAKKKVALLGYEHLKFSRIKVINV